MINSKTFEILEQLAAIEEGSGSRTEKIEILKANKDVLQDYFDIAMNPYRVYKVNKLPKKATGDSNFGTLTNLINWLENQKGGTNEMKQECRNYIETLKDNHKPFVEAAILKNLKIGVEVKTLNKADYDIPSFELLLASPNKENDLSDVEFPCYVQPKLDGCRCVRTDKGEYLTRNGRAIENNCIKDHVLIHNGTEYYVDGEFYSHTRKFNSIVSYFASEDTPLPEDIKFNIFNIIPKNEWNEQKSSLTYTQQLELMKDIAAHSKNVQVVETYKVNNKEELMAKYNEFLAKGYEGAMVRGIDSKYAWKRVKNNEGVLLKMKPFDYADLLIKSAYEGLDRNKGRLGGFICDYKGVEVKIGGGFSDEMREQFWADKQKYIGKWCRASFQEVTEDGSLRFPIFDNFRDAK